MFQVHVTTARGTQVLDAYVTEPSCTIGKDGSNAVVLHSWRIASKHARLDVEEDGLFLRDLGSRSGTRVNGDTIRRYGPLSKDDVIEIHDYRLRVSYHHNRKSTKDKPVLTGGEELAQNDGSLPNEVDPSSENLVPTSADMAVVAGVNQVDTLTMPGMSNKEAALMHEWRVRLRSSLHEQMDLRRVDVSSMTDEALREFCSRLIREILAGEREIPDWINQKALVRQVVAEAVGLGPLEPLLGQTDISEIMVNCAEEIFFEKEGRIHRSDIAFTDDTAVQSIIQRIVAPLGRRIDESSPMVDARLKDGSRINAIIPPLALKGSCLTIRKFMKERLTGEHLQRFGSISREMVDFLDVAVHHKRNIIISGGTGSGKTTLLNVLSNFIPKSERIVTIEDSAELRLYQPNLVSLEARPPNQEGRGAVAIRDLVRNALRMRPDRIVVGECRGGEALDMLQAMNTGHDGSLTTAHANSPRDCLSRIEVMVMMAGMDLPITAIREQIASAVNLIVQQTRFGCGSRKITSISEVVGIESGKIQLSEVFRFRQTGYDENNRVTGRFEATGLVPEFYEELNRRGVSLDMNLFNPPEETTS